MVDETDCPECGSHETDVVHREFLSDLVEVVRVCTGCPTEWTVAYGNPIVTDVHAFSE